MSSVPKSRRKPNEKFQVIEDIKQLRKMINNLLVMDYYYDKIKYQEKIDKLKSSNAKHIDLMIEKYNAFNSWFTIDERHVILNYIREIEKEVNIANNVYIITLWDYDQRRYHFSEALGLLWALNAELQEVIAFFPVDSNKYLSFGKQIEKVSQGIKGIKKHDDEKRRKILGNKSKDDKSDEKFHDGPREKKTPIHEV